METRFCSGYWRRLASSDSTPGFAPRRAVDMVAALPTLVAAASCAILRVSLDHPATQMAPRSETGIPGPARGTFAAARHQRGRGARKWDVGGPQPLHPPAAPSAI